VQAEEQKISFLNNGFIVTCILFSLIIVMIVLGTVVAATKWGDKKN
jgi:hypothetical protein